MNMNSEIKKVSVFKKALVKTKRKIKSIVNTLGGIENLTFDDLEDILLSTDLPLELVEDFINDAKQKYVSVPDAIVGAKEYFLNGLEKMERFKISDEFTTYLLIGANGTGKTTSCAKLAHFLSKKGKKPLFAAADTFRAAGSEQLEVWAKKLGYEVVSQSKGAHPGAVVFDAIKKAKSLSFDCVIADTAGRLHTKHNLMEELKKIKKSSHKAESKNKVITMLVLDAHYGQNTLAQVEEYSSAIGVDYLIVTKVDGSAKAGAVLAASIKSNIPIAFIGTGEKIEDFKIFTPTDFVNAFFSTFSEENNS